MTNKIYIIAGGTLVHVSPHFALAAPAYGKVGSNIKKHLDIIKDSRGDKNVEFILLPTKMAFYECMNYVDNKMYKDILDKVGLSSLETYYDVKRLVKYLTDKEDTKGIILPAAICDYEPRMIRKIDANKMFLRGPVIHNFGKNVKRLKTSEGNLSLEIQPTDKIVTGIRRRRRDIFLVSFKTTTNESIEDSYKIGLRSMKDNKSNLVFINDIQRKVNMIMTPEEYVYSNENRESAIVDLCEMIWDRFDLNFHKIKVKGKSRAKFDYLKKRGSIPENFTKVLNSLIVSKAYKPFEVVNRHAVDGKSKYKNITTGHFGCRVTGENFERISSMRDYDHNKVFSKGMIKIHGDVGNEMVVSGGKPSVGEHTQRLIYEKFGDKIDSIVHFHCPMRDGVSDVPERPQKPFQCGTDECAKNTVDGMEMIQDGIYAIHLTGHGPNIAFGKDVDPDVIVKFIDDRWDLSEKENGLDNIPN